MLSREAGKHVFPWKHMPGNIGVTLYWLYYTVRSYKKGTGFCSVPFLGFSLCGFAWDSKIWIDAIRKGCRKTCLLWKDFTTGSN
jgi:hypothetical protein